MRGSPPPHNGQGWIGSKQALSVARTAIAALRTAGVADAYGMGVGGVLFALAAIFRLQAALTATPAAFVALKIVCGVYLV